MGVFCILGAERVYSWMLILGWRMRCCMTLSHSTLCSVGSLLLQGVPCNHYLNLPLSSFQSINFQFIQSVSYFSTFHRLYWDSRVRSVLLLPGARMDGMALSAVCRDVESSVSSTGNSVKKGKRSSLRLHLHPYPVAGVGGGGCASAFKCDHLHHHHHHFGNNYSRRIHSLTDGEAPLSFLNQCNSSLIPANTGPVNPNKTTPASLRMETTITTDENQGSPSPILPFLFLGSEADAADIRKLELLGITYILNVTAHLQVPSIVNESRGFRHKRLPVTDSCKQNMLPYFEDAFEFIGELIDAREELERSEESCNGSVKRRGKRMKSRGRRGRERREGQGIVMTCSSGAGGKDCAVFHYKSIE